MAETAIRECGQEHRELVARQKAELSAMKAKATDSITEELVISLVSQECQSLAVDEYRCVNNGAQVGLSSSVGYYMTPF